MGNGKSVWSEGTSERIRGRNDIVVDTKKDGSERGREERAGERPWAGRPNKTPIEDVEEDEIKGLPLPSHFRSRRPLGRTNRRTARADADGRKAPARTKRKHGRRERKEKVISVERTKERTPDGWREGEQGASEERGVRGRSGRQFLKLDLAHGAIKIEKRDGGKKPRGEGEE